MGGKAERVGSESFITEKLTGLPRARLKGGSLVPIWNVHAKPTHVSKYSLLSFSYGLSYLDTDNKFFLVIGFELKLFMMLSNDKRCPHSLSWLVRIEGLVYNRHCDLDLHYDSSRSLEKDKDSTS